MERSSKSWAYPAALIVAWAVASWHWLAGRRFIPWDSFDAFFPQVAFIVAAVRRGEWPTWNPLVFGGQPVLGDPQGMIFTPHVVTGLLSGPAFGLWVFDVTTLACMLVGALCLYSYARGHGSAPPLAALGALVFLLGGYGTSRLQHVPQIISFALLPILLLTFHKVVQKPTLRATLALFTTGALLALNPNHVVFLTLLMLAPLFLLELSRAKHLPAVSFSLFTATLLVALVVAPSLSAILETVAHSTRHTLTLAHNDPASLPSFTALSLLIPRLFGSGRGGEGYWGPVDSTEAYLYIGVVPAAAIILGMARREAPTLALYIAWAMGLFAFLFAMGTRGPVFPWLYENVPGFSLFRRPSDGAYFLMLYCGLAVALSGAVANGRLRNWPERLAIPSVFFLLLLFCFTALVNYAGQLGRMDALADDLTSFAARALVALLVLFLLWRFWPKPHRAKALCVAAIALTTIDLATAGRGSGFSTGYGNNGFAPMYRVLKNWEGSESGEAESIRQIVSAQPQGGRVEIIGGAPVNTPMVFGLPTSQGYNPLTLQRYAEVFGAQNLGAQPKAFSHLAPSLDAEAYRWLGLRFLLLHNYILDHAENFGEFGQTAVELREDALASGAREVTAEGAYLVLELANPYPRAGFIRDEETLPKGSAGHCEIISETTTKAQYLCKTSFAAKLVIGDSFAPGWWACVNGEEAQIEPFLHALRSVAIPVGTSLVEMRYQPVPFLRRFMQCTKHPEGLSLSD